jgi:uncharacterized protein (DUF488 family)
MLMTGLAGGLVGVGYEGRDLDGFLSALTADSVEVLADVRLTPISRKRGFSKRALGEALSGVGIDYQHYRVLGNPKPNRAGFWGAQPELEEARLRYQELLDADEAVHALEQLAATARSSRVAVMCFEADEMRCHRQVVLEQLQRFG